MSLFTKRRLKIRHKQEENRRRWNESSKRMEKSMNVITEVIKIIEKKYPEYENITYEERVKIYEKEYNKYCKENDIKY